MPFINIALPAAVPHAWTRDNVEWPTKLGCPCLSCAKQILDNEENLTQNIFKVSVYKCKKN